MIAADDWLLGRADLQVVSDEPAARLRLMTREDEYAIEGAGVAKLRGALERLGRGATLEALAQASGLRPAALAGWLEPLVREGVVLNFNAPLAAESIPEFLEALRRECVFWHGTLLAHPFWETLLAGRAPLGLVYGWGLEFRHFADAANEYMAAGVAFCRDGGELRQRLSQHYIEESGHGEIFLQGLVECGLTSEEVSAAVPLASTRALINYLWETATEGSHAYLAGFSLMQAAEASAPAADAFLEHLSGHYPAARGLLRAFHRHTLVDIGLRHDQSLLAELCRTHGADFSQRRQALAAVRNLAEHFTAFFEGIRVHYHTDTLVPRRRRSSAFLESLYAADRG